ELVRTVAAYNAKSPTPVTLVLSGDGSRRAGGERLCGEVFGEHNENPRPIPQNPALYARVDALAHYSLYEGLPLGLIDAMACGLPCLATDVIGCRDAIERDVSGLLVPVGDIEAGAAALRRIVEGPGEAQRLGAAALARASSVFSPEAFV